MTDLRSRLAILADAAKYDASCASSGSSRHGKAGGLGNTNKVGICHSYTPDGRCVSLLKILLTNHCLYDCQYCVNRVTSDVPRARFSVDEVVYLTMEFYRRNYIEGLFLSSGVIQSIDYTMEQLIAVAKTLRTVHKYNGYIHLKTVPGGSEALIRQAGLWADRLSANIELPTQPDLDKLAPQKTIAQVEQTMKAVQDNIHEAAMEKKTSRFAPSFAPAGQSTQMIVGATPSTDATILQTASNLYRRHRLRRVYYSAFSPIPHGDARLPVAPPPLIREHRLYQADWLLRFYGFRPDEITPASDPTLDLEIDPKLAWALRNRGFFPVDLNSADFNDLLRVPGLGKRNVMRICQIRRYRKLRLIDLPKLRVPIAKVRPWIVTADHNPDLALLDRQDLRLKLTKPNVQLELFPPAVSAVNGEV